MKDDFISTDGETFAVQNSDARLKIAEQMPFNIRFFWEPKRITVTLVNGEDVLKLAKLFAEMLDKAEIEYTIKENDDGTCN